MEPQRILEWIQSFSHVGVFALLLLCGVGAPLSEDVIALGAGIVASKAKVPLWTMIVTVWAGTLAGDYLLFRIGRLLGPRATSHPRLSKVLKPERVAWVQSFFARHGIWTVAVARFLPGVRAPTFLIAGMSQVPPRRFLLADGAAAIGTAAALTTLGHRFGLTVLASVKSASSWLLVLVLAAAVAWAGVQYVRTRRRLAKMAG